MGFVMAFALPFLMAIIWGVFAVPEDPSRSGKAPVPISGKLRLLLEILIFLGAVWALRATGFPLASKILGLLVTAHYLFSLDRIDWLLAGRRD